MGSGRNVLSRGAVCSHQSSGSSQGLFLSVLSFHKPFTQALNSFHVSRDSRAYTMHGDLKWKPCTWSTLLLSCIQLPGTLGPRCSGVPVCVQPSDCPLPALSHSHTLRREGHSSRGAVLGQRASRFQLSSFCYFSSLLTLPKSVLCFLTDVANQRAFGTFMGFSSFWQLYQKGSPATYFERFCLEDQQGTESNLPFIHILNLREINIRAFTHCSLRKSILS